MSFNALVLKKTSLCDFKVKNRDVLFKFIGQQRSIQNTRVDYRSIMCEMLECFCIEHCLSSLYEDLIVDMEKKMWLINLWDLKCRYYTSTRAESSLGHLHRNLHLQWTWEALVHLIGLTLDTTLHGISIGSVLCN